MRYFTITHREVPWALPAFTTLIGSGPGIPADCLDLASSFPETRAMDPSLSEFRQLFALRRMLEADNEQGLVGVSHYRRFAVTAPDLAPMVGHQQLTDPRMFEKLPDDVFLGDEQSLVIPAHILFNCSVLAQYGANHISRDLLYFFALAADLGVISNEHVAAFLSQNGFIAVPTIGIFPAPWLIGALTALELVATTFAAHFLQQREGYNGRSVAFCCERLMAFFVQVLSGSWQLTKHQYPALILSEDGEITNSDV